ncbi:hypothetical protein MKK88_16950 [Methylobacterium sp. E-005]|uniref:hypothetical protein n=1 Tax=Methylobacterium sp. E-005 TaxID=2836549 RepID=UPI001FBA5DCD|nr:hypothetical protein [Methylobacterium sp. E-005]MCJ2087658.1 hypothetical protein [Methylobacterium sp. E-005]
MGDGLKRAFAATARTRWDGKLTPEMLKFLKALAPYTVPQTRGNVGCVINRADDRARQKCKQLGLVGYDQREDGKWGWQITPHGRAALEQSA